LAALKSGFAAVAIEIETGDDPQTIFETLDSRGADLSARDLMRNFIFQRAKGMGHMEGSLTVDELYATCWQPLDGWFWREDDTRGRQTRSLIPQEGLKQNSGTSSAFLLMVSDRLDPGPAPVSAATRSHGSGYQGEFGGCKSICVGMKD